MARYPIQFGKYLLLERVNVGGMAEVFKCKTFGVAGFEKLAALKRILPSMVEDEEFIRMFIDEARISVQLNHANIVQIYELGRHGESYYIAMEYLPSRDLRTILDKLRASGTLMPIPQAAFVASKICEALDYAHRKKDPTGNPMNIIHRDVSPQNVLVGYEGEVKVIDFGIAKAANRASKTQAGVLKGKFGYMSPEQVRGLPIDRRSDVFAVGVLLYEMLTGERLFIGESDFSTLERVRNAEVVPPTTYNKKISRELETIVLKALAREVEDRYQWASDLAEDLQRFMIEDRNIYNTKRLAAYMRDVYASEIAMEQAKMEEYLKISAPAEPEPAPAEVGPERTFVFEASGMSAALLTETSQPQVKGGSKPAVKPPQPPTRTANQPIATKTSMSAIEDDDDVPEPQTDPTLAVPAVAEEEELDAKTSLSPMPDGPPEKSVRRVVPKEKGAEKSIREPTPAKAPRAAAAPAASARPPMAAGAPGSGTGANQEALRRQSARPPLQPPKADSIPNAKVNGSAHPPSGASLKGPPVRDNAEKSGRNSEKSKSEPRPDPRAATTNPNNEIGTDSGDGFSDPGIPSLKNKPITEPPPSDPGVNPDEVSADGTEESDPPPTPMDSPGAGAGNKKVIIGAVAAAVVVLLAVVGTAVALKGPAAGGIKITMRAGQTVPAVVEVSIDSIKRGATLPIEFSDIPPGDHTVTVTSPGMIRNYETLTVEKGKVRSIQVEFSEDGGSEPEQAPPEEKKELKCKKGDKRCQDEKKRLEAAESKKEEPKAEPKKEEEPRKEEPKAEAKQDETKKEEPRAEAKKEEPKKEEPKAEAKKEEPKKEEPKAEAKKEEPRKEEPKAEAKKEEPKAEAKKEETKKEERKAEAKKEEAKKEERKAEAKKEEAKKEEHKAEAKKEEPKKAEPVGSAELLINTKPISQVFLDNKDTKLWTPVPKAKALKVAPGKHTLMFVTKEGAKFSYQATIEAGENKLIIMELGQPPKEGGVSAKFVGESK